MKSRPEAGATRMQPKIPMTTIRKRWRLPHWEEERAIYFVTFRLADSLPQSYLRRIESEKRLALEDAAARKLPGEDQRKIEKTFAARIEKFLDSGARSCDLAKPEIADLTASALRHFVGVRYRLFA